MNRVQGAQTTINMCTPAGSVAPNPQTTVIVDQENAVVPGALGITACPGSQLLLHGRTLNANTVTVDEGASIAADGRGGTLQVVSLFAAAHGTAGLTAVAGTLVGTPFHLDFTGPGGWLTTPLATTLVIHGAVAALGMITVGDNAPGAGAGTVVVDSLSAPTTVEGGTLIATGTPQLGDVHAGAVANQPTPDLWVDGVAGNVTLAGSHIVPGGGNGGSSLTVQSLTMDSASTFGVEFAGANAGHTRS